jgi:hypothetical protein
MPVSHVEAPGQDACRGDNGDTLRDHPGSSREQKARAARGGANAHSSLRHRASSRATVTAAE